MHAVVTIDEDGEITPVAVGFDEADATELTAKHIMQTHDPAWPDLVTVFEAGVFEQVVALWNQNTPTMPEPLEYRIIDFTAAMDAFVERDLP